MEYYTQMKEMDFKMSSVKKLLFDETDNLCTTFKWYVTENLCFPRPILKKIAAQQVLRKSSKNVQVIKVGKEFSLIFKAGMNG